MPKQANIVVKAPDNSDVTFTALSGSAGDRVPAIYRNDSDGTLPLGMRPTFRIATQDNGPKTARRLTVDGVWPTVYTDTQTGQKGVLARIPLHLELTLPTNADAYSVGFYSSILLALCASTAVKDSAVAGYAPTSA